MGISLTPDELHIALQLRSTDIPLPTSVLAIIMFTRQHSRPMDELIDIVRQYPNLEDRRIAKEAILELRRLNWLEETQSFGRYLIHCSSDIKEKIAQRINDKNTIEKLTEMKSDGPQYLRILGSMNDKYIYQSYIDLLANAQSEVCLPMLATSPEISSVPIIQDRARKGVSFKILLASPDVAAKVRGSTIKQIARDSIEGWSNNARNIKGMEVRISHSVEDMLIATSMLIDNQLLRFDIYDPLKQRSLEGTMLEAESSNGLQLNIVSLFKKSFDDAWNKSQPINMISKVIWWIKREWQWLAFIIFTILTFIASITTVWGSIFGSVAATFLINALASSWNSIKLLFKRKDND